MRGPFRDPLPHQDWGEAPDTAGFVGRAKELQALQSWVRDERCRMVAVLGMGGVGKTSLATRLVREVAPIFERIYWRSLRDAPPPSDWLAGAIAFLSDQQREPPAAESERLATLMQLLRERRCLLVLDNFDTLFEPGQSEGRYREGLDGYGRLLLAVGESTHQSCLVLTSREAPQERAVLISDMTRTLRLGGLSVDEAQKLLAPKAVAGSRSDWVELTNRCSGNGLALKIVGETIRDRFVGQIASFLAQAPGGSALTGLRELLTDQIERSPAAEQEMLEVLALHREPQTLTELRAALGVDSSRAAPIDTIEALRRRSLVERVRIGGTTGFTLQSVVLEYLTDRLVESVADEIRRKQPSLLVRVPLIKAQAKDYVRCAQEVLIGEAILGQLADSRDTNERLLALLQSWRNQPATDQGYGPGNVINLLRLLRGDLRGLDLSRLEIRQAYLAEVEAQAASLAGAHLEHVVLPDAFAMPLTLVLSADGAFLAAGTSDGEVWLWRVADRQLLLAIQEHRSAVQGLALSADGVVMATGDHSGTVRLWDTSFAVDDRTRSRLVRTAPSEHSADPSAAGGRLLATLTGHSMAVLCTAFAPDGRLLASGGTGGTVRLWDAISGRPVARLQGHTGAVFSLAFSADGRVLASGGADQTIRLWDVSTGEALLTLQEQVGVVRSLAFSADGTVMASGTEDGSVRVWQASTRDVLARFRAHSGGVWSVALAADGHLLASGGGDGMARLWDPRTGQLLTTLHAHTAGVIGAGLSADGNLVATGSEDGTIRLWDAHTGRGLATLQGQPGGVRSLALSADGHVVATAGGDRLVRLWHGRSGQMLATLRGHTGGVRDVALSADGSVLASGGSEGTLRLWNAPHDEGNAAERWVGPGLDAGRSSAGGHATQGRALATFEDRSGEGVALSPDGRLLANHGSVSGIVRVWDVSSGALLVTLQAHSSAVWAAALSADGQLLATGGADGTARLWELPSGRSLANLECHPSGVSGVALSADGQWLAATNADGTVRLWEISTRRLAATPRGHTSAILGVALSNDGHVLVSGDADGTVWVWTVPYRQPSMTLRGHTGAVWRVALSAEEGLVASASWDGTARVWDLSSGVCLHVLRSVSRYKNLDITGLSGVTDAQRAALMAMGAVVG